MKSRVEPGIAEDLLALASADNTVRFNATARLAALSPAEFERLLADVPGLSCTIPTDTNWRGWILSAIGAVFAAVLTPLSDRIIPKGYMFAGIRFLLIWCALAASAAFLANLITRPRRGGDETAKLELQPLRWPAFCTFLSELRAPHLIPTLIASLDWGLLFDSQPAPTAVRVSLAHMLPAIAAAGAPVLGPAERSVLRNHVAGMAQSIHYEKIDATHYSELADYIRGAVIALTAVRDARAVKPMQALLSELRKTNTFPDLAATLEVSIAELGAPANDAVLLRAGQADSQANLLTPNQAPSDMDPDEMLRPE